MGLRMATFGFIYATDSFIQRVWMLESQAQIRRRTFHEPNLIQIKVGPNHENPAF